MKIVKCIGKVLFWIVVAIVALIAALPLWIGPAAKTAANAIVPKKTGTSFNLGTFALNPYSGRLAVGDMQLWNPDGFDQNMAVTLGELGVAVDTASLFGDVIVVKDIVLKDVFVSYVSNAKGENNFAIIKKNAAGEDAAKGEGPATVKGEGEQGKQSSKKVIIDHLLIANVKVQLGPLTIPMPNIELSGIGRKSNGATLEEAWQQVSEQVMKNLKSLGVNVDDLVKGLKIKGLENINAEQVMHVIDAAKKVDVKDAVSAGTGILSKTTDASLGAATKGVTKTTEAVGDTTKKAVDAAGEGVNKSVEKATETFKAIKSLF